MSTGCGRHTCEGGEVDGPGYPEVDVRTIPHAIRQARIFGALESVHPGAGLELVAPHDASPLLDQVNQRWPGAFSVACSERGPEAWRLWCAPMHEPEPIGNMSDIGEERP